MFNHAKLATAKVITTVSVIIHFSIGAMAADNSCQSILSSTTESTKKSQITNSSQEKTQTLRFRARDEIKLGDVTKGFADTRFHYFQSGVALQFSKFKIEDFIPAYQEFLDYQRSVIQAITNQKARPTFENTILPQEELSILEGNIFRYFNFFYSINSFRPDVKELYKKIIPLSSAASNEIGFNADLYKRVKAISAEGLSEPRKRLLADSIESFESSGVGLSNEDKRIYEKIKGRLPILGQRFVENMERSYKANYIVVENLSELEGVSQKYIDGFKKAAEERGIAGYVISQNGATQGDIMTKATNRELRKKVWFLNRKLANRAPYDNRPVIKQIVSLRQQLAKLLGYQSYLDAALEGRMVQNKERLANFLQSLGKAYGAEVKNEDNEVKNFAKERYGVERMAPWDFGFYVEKLMEEKYTMDTNVLKQYFEINAVWGGAFKLAERLYGIQIAESHAYQTPDENVKVYEVSDHGALLGLLYVDPYARPGLKRGGAWHSSLSTSNKVLGSRDLAVSLIATNFMKAESGPTLLTDDEVVTVFHEFGHSLHAILTQAELISQSGTRVTKDMVELPSQFMENFVYEPEVLKTFAYNVNNPSEVIPDSLIESLRRSQNFRAANAGLTQVIFATIDYRWHSSDYNQQKNVYKFERAIRESYVARDLVEEKKNAKEIAAATKGKRVKSRSAMSTRFAHIFNGGYAAGYYSYKWAEVLEADAFNIFKLAGFDEATASRFRTNILEVGDSVDADEAYVAFAGREASIEPLLIRSGLLKSSSSDDSEDTDGP